MTKTPNEFLQQAFEPLADRELEILRSCGTERPTAPGQVLFQSGDRDYPLFVVQAGRLRIIDRSFGLDRVLRESGPGEFMGELGLLTGQTVFLNCEVVEGGSVLEIPAPKLRKLIRTIPELADRIVTAFAARREYLMETAAATLKLIGSRDCGPALSLREFLDRNRIPHIWVDRDDPDVAQWLPHYEPLAPALQSGARVVAIVRGGLILSEPTTQELAGALGLELSWRQDRPADVLVIGTGPAGMAAAVYGASEGLDTLALDDVAIGGQAGTSSRIENYLGFPNGISGGDLAFRGQVQAVKFGARITVPRCAEKLERDGDGYAVTLTDGKQLRGRSVVIATGARYRRLGLARQEEFEGAGIYYAATNLESRLCEGQPVVVVGGGNSAGQAAMFLARTAECVHLLYRGADLRSSMSEYLVNRLEYNPNVEIRTGTQVRELRGNGHLSSTVITGPDGREEELPTGAMFVMIGADPCTSWLRGTLDLDEKGFIVTGAGAPDGAIPSPFATSLPGVFAVGDVRSGSVKRVASAVGEGSVVVQAIHSYLGTLDPVPGQEPANRRSARDRSEQQVAAD
ncbi:MAG TPA: FAD-dependent oxidoreductase [Thermomicrobiales bacterium]|jgi:thioredoxin reductase (NADPH)|nr:FAD-dependent oxidoreductase [Thermomicrobiales bacterium]